MSPKRAIAILLGLGLRRPHSRCLKRSINDEFRVVNLQDKLSARELRTLTEYRINRNNCLSKENNQITLESSCEKKDPIRKQEEKCNNNNNNCLIGAKKDLVSRDAPSLFPLKSGKNNDRYTAEGKKILLYGPWEYTMWSRDQLESESNLKKLRPTCLLYHSSSNQDARLWGYLLNYRYQIYGLAGVRMFWRAILNKKIVLPTSGPLAKDIWTTFLQLGFSDDNTLKQICDYADKLFEREGKRWLLLYDNIVEHFLVKKSGKKALMWHERLFPLHPPGANRFRAFFREVVHQNGDISALKTIYQRSPYRNVYSGVITLCFKRGKIKDAVDWHVFLLKNHDFPSSLKIVEPLIKYLSKYDTPKYNIVTKSIVEANVFPAPETIDTPKDYTKISGELMNIVHGKTFGISVKKYNDELGARWFATEWVSLETAIKTVLALGVQEIGPLSLQAIALRDPTVESVNYWIDQLRELGISIGKSIFARSVEHFSRNQMAEFLHDLLHSDQHPDQLEDQKLQEELLHVYAKSNNWPGFYRTLEIKSLSSKNPDVYKKNMMVKVLFLNERASDAKNILGQMQDEGTPIKSTTISCMIRHMLKPRRRSHGPSSDIGDLKLVVKFLREMMRFGYCVPPYHWREIIRRLGMLGRFDYLESVCLSLGQLYLSSQVKAEVEEVSPEIQPNHPRHPTHNIFDKNFQRVVVEWGFIHPLRFFYKENFVDNEKEELSQLPDITFGINLLKKLQKLGVFIDGNIVSRAIMNRLVTYFSPEISTKRHNREAQLALKGHFVEVVQQLESALGQNYFIEIDDFPSYLQQQMGPKIRRLKKAQIKWRKKAKMKGYFLK
ncbi:putative pentatricopeptide repeat domain-containing protein [Golovinomyces cichoracearum]|uniref:Putative pentatricopeptide repeat domain-containing protein n=1 Tax=Golovinomyces cichoracearum TaxID=62708 RepID=A0A420HD36_9PEZI|nr:putative pentatricopeptide repeat domain-containing protein [Golovinomyces cichoracearum]